MEENQKVYKRKRIFSFIVVGAYLFLGGSEYAVIFPTAWSYLESLGATEEESYMLGFIVSAYSFSAAISGIIGGRLSDVYPKQTKRIAYFSILIMAIGNIMYMIGYSVWNILASRLVCGIGTSAGAAMLAEICRNTAFEERTPILAICNAARQLGILIGPAFQLLLSSCHFTIFNLITITPLNAPGLFMAALWSLFSIMILFMFNNLTEDLEKLTLKLPTSPTISGQIIHNFSHDGNATLLSRESLEKSESFGINRKAGTNYGAIPPINGDSTLNSSSHMDTSLPPVAPSSKASGSGIPNRKRSVSERFIHSFQQSSQKIYNTGEISLMNASVASLQKSYGKYVDEFLKDTFVVLLSMVFSLFFCQVGVETLIPIIMEGVFGYGIFENSLIYMVGGLLALILFFTVAIVSRFVRDTTLNMIGWSIMFSSQIFLMIVIANFEEGNPSHMKYFLMGVFFIYIGYPISSSANTGLFSKALSNETQGLGQGIRRMVSYLGLIFGPMWAGSTAHRPYLLFAVPCGIMLFNATMFLCSFKRLRQLETDLRSRGSSEISSFSEGRN